MALVVGESAAGCGRVGESLYGGGGVSNLALVAWKSSVVPTREEDMKLAGEF